MATIIPSSSIITSSHGEFVYFFKIKMAEEMKDNEIVLKKDPGARRMVINNDDLPLTIVYKGKRYILILTKNDKLILNKYTD